MKQISALVWIILFFLPAVLAADSDDLVRNDLIASISRAREPVVSGKFAVFTADGNIRHAGVAFEHENFSRIHSFKRLIRRDLAGKPTSEVLFYILDIPPLMTSLRYRMVIDGLWTTDPHNPVTVFDYVQGFHLSSLPVDYYEVFQTNNVSDGLVRFTWEGESGKTIRLAGTFNNWDPFMYELTETVPGKYEIRLPLPRGKWLYAFYDGTRQLPDTINRDRVYTKDGRIASVITIP